MHTPRPIRIAAAALFLAALATPRAHAVNKDMIQLQTQIQDLQNAVAKLQQSNDERMGVLKDLVQQTADSVNKMSVAVDGVKLQLQNQQEATGAKTEQLSGQIQSLNDTLDELKARMARLDKATSDIQGQLSTISGTINNLPQTTATPTGPAPTAAPPTDQPAAPTPISAAPDQTLPPTDAVVAPRRGAQIAATSGAPPIADMYRAAFADYNSAKYPLAASEFDALAQAYPDDNLAGNAYFYMGEIDLRTQKPTAAVHMYDHLIEHFPDNVKIPAAHLHKADAMISMKQNPGAARELQALIQRFPNSPEAAAARNKLAVLSAHR